MADYAKAMYEKFLSSQQAAVRLELALNGFFSEEAFTCQQKQAFADYLKTRIRPAVQSLIEQDDTDKIQRMDALDWMSASIVDENILYAIRQNKTQGFLCLLKIKAEKYGFHDRNFDW